MPSTTELGLLLVGHGTRSEIGTRQFLEVSAAIARRRPDVLVEPALLELQQPDVATALARLAERGAQQIVVAPLLLFAAGHAKSDIPELVAAARRDLGLENLPQAQAEPLGCDPRLVELSALRLKQLLSSLPAIPAAETCLLHVGRGSSDAEAIAEMRRFVAMRTDSSLARESQIAFVAKADPPVKSALRALAAVGFRRIIVQPHLLFEGEVITSVRRYVEEERAQSPQCDWQIADVLADAPGQGGAGEGTAVLAELAVARFVQAVDSCCRPAGG